MTEVFDHVARVNIYPLKSLQAATVNGETPDTLDVGPTGFKAGEVLDREFILYDPVEGSLVTQRGWAKHTQKEKFPQDKRLAALMVDIRDDHITIAQPFGGQLEIPSITVEGQKFDVDIFGRTLATIPSRQVNSSYSLWWRFIPL